MKQKFEFSAIRTWHKNDYNYIHILPRVTFFVSPVRLNEDAGITGKYYDLTIGFLIWECSISLEVRK